MMALFKRPLKLYERKRNESFTVVPSPSECLHVVNCVDCTFTVASPLAKCTIERCNGVKVIFQERLMSGQMEVMFSNDITITTGEEIKIPTITIDNTSEVNMYLHQPKNIGIIHTVGVNDVMVHMDPPHTSQKLEHPIGEDGEFMTRCSVGKLFTERVVREGCGYLTTVREKEIADKKAEQFEQKITEFVRGMITTPGAKPSTQPAVGGTSEKENKPEEPPKRVTVSIERGSMGDALVKGKQALKPTETVERHVPVVGTGNAGGGRKPESHNIKEDTEKKEFFDTEEQLDKKVKQVARWMRESKHTIMFTGAGISTSAGIPDFRSGMGTVLATGPGVWELQDKGASRDKDADVVPILKALPTTTHMAIVRMHEADIVKYTVSQNVDGLHRRSGLPPSQLAELHGNTNLEICKQCHRQYLRDFETREAMHVFDHTTARKCDDPSCGGQLKDTIVNFGESLPQREIEESFDHAQKADLCVVLGSSLRVRPACQVPEVVLANGGKVVICNLQKIPQFPPNSRTTQVYALCDKFIQKLMHELQLDIPKFVLSRRLKVTSEKKDDDLQVTVTGIDVDADVPYSYIAGVSMNDKVVKKEPLSLTIPMTSDPVKFTVHFHGHYREPPLSLTYDPQSGPCYYWLNYDISTREWHTLCKV